MKSFKAKVNKFQNTSLHLVDFIYKLSQKFLELNVFLIIYLVFLDSI